MPKIEVSLSIGFANATQTDVLDIDETEWADCETDEEREKLMDDYWTDWSRNYIDGGVVLLD